MSEFTITLYDATGETEVHAFPYGQAALDIFADDPYVGPKIKAGLIEAPTQDEACERSIEFVNIALADGRWTQFKTEHDDEVLIGPCTLAEADDETAKIVFGNQAETQADIRRLIVEQPEAVLAARDTIERIFAGIVGPEQAAKIRGDFERRYGLDQSSVATHGDREDTFETSASASVSAGQLISLADATEVEQALRSKLAALDTVAWSLTSSLSDIRKASAGYRNPDAATGREPEHAGISAPDLARRFHKAKAVLAALEEAGV